MAKKKAADKAEPKSTSDFIDRIYDKVQAEFGKQAIISGKDYCEEKIIRVPIGPSLDSICHGGIDEGSFVGITGHEKTGKTTTALSFAANCQRPEYGGRPVFYGKAEGRLSRQHTQGIEGLNFEKPHFNVIQSTQGKILSAQDHLKIYEDILKSVPGCLLIIDSISSLVDQRVLDGGVGTQTRGSGAQLFSQWLDLVKDVVVVNKCIVVGITHLISNTGGMPGGPQYSEKAARNWKYMYNYAFRTAGKTPWKAGEKVIGLEVNWECTTTPNGGSPFSKMVSLIRFGVGVDRLAELIRLAETLKLIKKSGSWYELEFLSVLFPDIGIIKGQGTEGVYKILKKNPEYAKALYDTLRSLMSEEEDVEETEPEPEGEGSE